MEKKQFQLELFKSKKYEIGSFKKKQHHPNFFGFIKIHEKAISIVIVFVLISLITFSLGVEKGKRLTTVQIKTKNEQAEIKKLRTQDKKQDNKPKIDQEDISKYTIQVASFKTRTYAQREAKRLEQKGLEALIIPKGKYICVYVGNFSKEQEL